MSSLLIGRHVPRFLVAFHIFLGFTSTLANTVILAALYKESSLHPPSKILLRSLALTDVFVGIIVEPLFATHLMIIEYTRLDLCYLIFSISIFTGQVLSLVSLFTLTAISVDRLLALLLGMRYRQVVTFKRALMIVFCFWILNIGFATAIFWNMSVNLYFIIIGLLFCIIVSTCCYIKIYLKLFHHQAQIQEHVHQGQPNGHEPLNIARYRKTVSSALWVQFSVLACYLPMGIVMILITIRGVTLYLSIAWAFSTMFMFFNSTLNPIVYCWKIRGVRRVVMEIIRQVLCCSSS